MEMQLLDPTQVTVREGLARYRTDMGALEGLADSIERVGKNILPIIITRQFELIDGGRRLAACIMKGMQVRAVFEDVKDDYEYRELEVESNLHRKDFSPAEEALAIRDLHNLKQKRLGVGGSGTTEGWSIKNTADLLGKTRGSVYNALEMATLIDTFPELKQAKKKSEIRKAGKSLEKLAVALEGIKRIETANKEGNNLFKVELANAAEHMCKVPDASIDILLTDPLYGIGADLISMSVGGSTGGCFSTAGFKIEDPKEAAYFYYHLLAQQSIRFCKNTSHGYVFVGPEHFWKIREIFLAAGWLVYVKPIIWIKREVGQCNVPSAWPSSCYEMLMYIRRENSRLVREGMPDWLECPPVPAGEKKHPYEKPVKLLTELLERVALPGQQLYDPFAGSGSSIEAGVKMKLFSTGIDVDKNAYAMMLGRMENVSKPQQVKETTENG